MTDTALNSNDHGKLFVFALLLLPVAVCVVGVIPFLFLVFGLVMLKKTRDFAHIETAARNYKIYCWLFLIGFAITAAYVQTQAAETPWEARDRNNFTIILCVFGAVAAFYIAALNHLFLYPLRQHRNWIEHNSIFSNRSVGEFTDADLGKIDIIKGERLRSFSVADELLKWAKLKEDGHISDEEFTEARTKLLQKS